MYRDSVLIRDVVDAMTSGDAKPAEAIGIFINEKRGYHTCINLFSATKTQRGNCYSHLEGREPMPWHHVLHNKFAMEMRKPSK